MSDNNTELKGLLLYNEGVAIENIDEEGAVEKFNKSFFDFHFIPAGRELVKLAIKYKDWEGAKNLLNRLCDYHGDALSIYYFGEVYFELDKRGKAVKALDGYLKLVLEQVDFICSAQLNKWVYKQNNLLKIKTIGYIRKSFLFPMWLKVARLVVRHPTLATLINIFLFGVGVITAFM